MQDLAGGGDNGLQFRFVPSQQAFVEGTEIRVEAHADHSRHVKNAAQMAIAGTTDARGTMDRAALGVLHGIEPTVRDPLAHVQIGRQHLKFPHNLQRAALPNAWDAAQQRVVLL
jgi:hypothetical protein